MSSIGGSGDNPFIQPNIDDNINDKIDDKTPLLGDKKSKNKKKSSKEGGLFKKITKEEVIPNKTITGSTSTTHTGKTKGFFGKLLGAGKKEVHKEIPVELEKEVPVKNEMHNAEKMKAAKEVLEAYIADMIELAHVQQEVKQIALSNAGLTDDFTAMENAIQKEKHKLDPLLEKKQKTMKNLKTLDPDCLMELVKEKIKDFYVELDKLSVKDSQRDVKIVGESEERRVKRFYEYIPLLQSLLDVVPESHRNALGLEIQKLQKYR